MAGFTFFIVVNGGQNAFKVGLFFEIDEAVDMIDDDKVLDQVGSVFFFNIDVFIDDWMRFVIIWSNLLILVLHLHATVVR
jgi:hypothetical protein